MALPGVVLLLALGLLAGVACTASGTVGPGDSGGRSGAATATPARSTDASSSPATNSGSRLEPTPTPGGGGGGSMPPGWDRYGKVNYTLSGPVSRAGEFGFAPTNSVFARSGGTDTLYYFLGPEGSKGGLTVATSKVGIPGEPVDPATGLRIYVQFSDGKLLYASEHCTASALKVEAAAASGNFDCTGKAHPGDPGADFILGVRITGTFSARAAE